MSRLVRSSMLDFILFVYLLVFLTFLYFKRNFLFNLEITSFNYLNNFSLFFYRYIHTFSLSLSLSLSLKQTNKQTNALSFDFRYSTQILVVLHA